jgi:hypothetical protein
VPYTPAAVVLTAFASYLPVAQAQPARLSDDVLSQLVAEVRQLRLAVERSSSVGPRIQLLTSRLAIQEQRVARLGSELDGLRQQLPRIAEVQRQAGDALGELEAAVSDQTDPQRRRQMQQEIASLKRHLESQIQEEHQLRVREGELLGLHSQEQARWLEISQRLDDLERALAQP